jgi:hypothetical protein
MKLNLSQKPIMIITHERSGTHLCMDYLRNFFQDTYLKQYPFQRTRNLYWVFPTLPTEKKLPFFISSLQNAKSRPLIKTHVTTNLKAIKDQAQRDLFHALFEESDHIYVVRDGRDVLVSYFYFRIKFNNGTRNFSNYLRSPLRIGHRTVVKYWADHITEWYDKLEQDKFVCFESLRNNLTETVTSLGHSLGLTRNNRAIQPIQVDKQRMVRALKCALGIQHSSAVLPGYGHSKTWASHFSESDKDFFKEVAGQELIDLGYEKDMDW